ncbi:MAG TPA: shikimate dehydrogenase [Gemmatimonadaceae bacterium]|nr:shikimate dehydrogenase [Gemmatimonadaceae bacterium]
MTRPTRLVLLGTPVAQSLSPTFQNAALDIAGLPVRYEALETPAAALDGVLAQLALEGAAGNVTIPHKVAVHDRCSALTPTAARAGAVNTFWFSDGTLHGDNTDVGGFRAAVDERLAGEQLPARVILLGAGGAAAAVCAAAEEWGAHSVDVVARSRGAAHRLAARFSGLVTIVDDAASLVREEPRRGRRPGPAPLVVNATPLGASDDDALPIEVALLPAGSAVVDLVYRRGETRFVREARAAGHRAADGLTMLLEQGALSFERWFGFAPDRQAMRRSVAP